MTSIINRQRVISQMVAANGLCGCKRPLAYGPIDEAPNDLACMECSRRPEHCWCFVLSPMESAAYINDLKLTVGDGDADGEP